MLKNESITIDTRTIIWKIISINFIEKRLISLIFHQTIIINRQ